MNVVGGIVRLTAQVIHGAALAYELKETGEKVADAHEKWDTLTIEQKVHVIGGVIRVSSESVGFIANFSKPFLEEKNKKYADIAIQYCNKSIHVGAVMETAAPVINFIKEPALFNSIDKFLFVGKTLGNLARVKAYNAQTTWYSNNSLVIWDCTAVAQEVVNFSYVYVRQGEAINAAIINAFALINMVKIQFGKVITFFENLKQPANKDNPSTIDIQKPLENEKSKKEQINILYRLLKDGNELENYKGLKGIPEICLKVDIFFRERRCAGSGRPLLYPVYPIKSSIVYEKIYINSCLKKNKIPHKWPQKIVFKKENIKEDDRLRSEIVERLKFWKKGYMEVKVQAAKSIGQH